MATPQYDALTPDQKEAIDASTNFVRSMSGEMGRLISRAVALDASYTAEGEAALNALAAGDLIPNKNGDPGALEMTRAEVVTLVGKFRNLHTAVTDIYGGSFMLSQYARATGPANMVE